jgi:hypothetical protein
MDEPSRSSSVGLTTWQTPKSGNDRVDLGGSSEEVSRRKDGLPGSEDGESQNVPVAVMASEESLKARIGPSKGFD